MRAWSPVSVARPCRAFLGLPRRRLLARVAWPIRRLMRSGRPGDAPPDKAPRGVIIRRRCMCRRSLALAVQRVLPCQLEDLRGVPAAQTKLTEPATGGIWSARHQVVTPGASSGGRVLAPAGAVRC